MSSSYTRPWALSLHNTNLCTLNTQYKSMHSQYKSMHSQYTIQFYALSIHNTNLCTLNTQYKSMHSQYTIQIYALSIHNTNLCNVNWIFSCGPVNSAKSSQTMNISAGQANQTWPFLQGKLTRHDHFRRAS